MYEELLGRDEKCLLHILFFPDTFRNSLSGGEFTSVLFALCCRNLYCPNSSGSFTDHMTF